MSHVVSQIGKAVSRVFQAVGQAVKSIIQSPIFKVIAVAAAVYFTAGLAADAFPVLGGTMTDAASATTITSMSETALAPLTDAAVAEGGAAAADAATAAAPGIEGVSDALGGAGAATADGATSAGSSAAGSSAAGSSVASDTVGGAASSAANSGAVDATNAANATSGASANGTEGFVDGGGLGNTPAAQAAAPTVAPESTAVSNPNMPTQAPITVQPTATSTLSTPNWLSVPSDPVATTNNYLDSLNKTWAEKAWDAFNNMSTPMQNLVGHGVMGAAQGVGNYMTAQEQIAAQKELANQRQAYNTRMTGVPDVTKYYGNYITGG